MSNADEMEALADTLERARRGYMELSNLPHTSAVYTDYDEAVVAIRAGAVASRQVAAVRELHKPFAIYTECGHDHEDTTDGDGVVQVVEIGLTCSKMYDICRECCADKWNEFQSEICSDEHKHGPDKPICATIAALSSAETGEAA